MRQTSGSGDLLRRAMAEARLRDVDVATTLAVDPKTVQRWLAGRLPQSRHRWALADVLKVSEFDLWPDVAAAGHVSPDVVATYDHRSAVPRDVWLRLFDGAEREIGILVYSGLFIAEDIEIAQLLERKAAEGVSVRILLGDPDSSHVADRGREEGIDEAMAAKIRNVIVLYRSLFASTDVQIRLHATVLYNSLFRSDNDLLVNQHVYGLAAAYAPVVHLRRDGESQLVAAYLTSFERIWDAATPLRPAGQDQLVSR